MPWGWTCTSRLAFEQVNGELEWNQVIYWRKVNWIHGWIVQHVAGGEDSSTEYVPINRDQLRQLQVICQKALVLAREGDWESVQVLLPPTPGFFFGLYQPLSEWDDDDRQYYLEETERTVQELSSTLRGAETDHFRYMAWW